VVIAGTLFGIVVVVVIVCTVWQWWLDHP